MENMTKYQLILLVLLVSFVTALVTGIVSVTLVTQAPQPITQTIQRVIEKTVEAAQKPLKPDAVAQLENAALARDVLVGDIVTRVSPAVVSVVATKDVPVVEQYYTNPGPQDDFFRQFFPDVQVPQLRRKGTEKLDVSSGTGFFASEDGLLITNRHVVEDTEAEYSIIMNDGSKLDAQVLARDPIHDVAVLKPKTSVPRKYSFINLGNSDTLKIGYTAIAIGNALGEFQNTVSVGVISGLRRTITAEGGLSGPEELSEVIQTDAAINPGNSGGPLLNLKGEVVGLNTAIAQGAENISFSIPINQIKKSLSDVQKSGKIIYPFLGVRYVVITPELKDEKKLPVGSGALLVAGPNGEPAVSQGGPATKAGLEEGDIIVEFDGKQIMPENTLSKLIQRKQVGDKVALKFLRDGKEMTVEIVLEER